MPGSDHLTSSIKIGLAFFYIAVALLNLGFAFYHYHSRRNRVQTVIWASVAGLFLLHAALYLAGVSLVLAYGIRNWVTNVMGLYGGQMGPILYSLLSVV